MNEKQIRRVSLAGLAATLTGAGLVYFSNAVAGGGEGEGCNEGEYCFAHSEFNPGVWYTGQCEIGGAFEPMCGCGGWENENQYTFEPTSSGMAYGCNP
jgi:hypothetical protein